MCILIFSLIVLGIIFFIKNKQKVFIDKPLNESSVKNKSNEDFFYKNNIGYFTQSKSDDESRYLTSLVVEVIEKKITYKDLISKIKNEFPKYDIKTFVSEYETFITMNDNYDTWKFIIKHKNQFPYLKYSTTNDVNVCSVCKKLNNIVLKVDDVFWDSFFPPNCFSCRCIVEQYDSFDVKKPTDISKIKIKEPINIFCLNVGKHNLKSIRDN